MKRLYFLIPNLDSAKSIVEELLQLHIPEKQIHLIAKEGTALGDLPEATLAQKSDLIPAVERGIAVGGTAGILAGVAAISFPPAGMVFGGGAILTMTLAGAGIGAWFCTLIGISTPNSAIKNFEQAIEQGDIMMLVDVPKDRAAEFEQVIIKHHPEAELEGTELTTAPIV